MEVVVSLSQGRTAAAQFGLFTHKSVPVIFEPLCIRNLKLFHRFELKWNTNACIRNEEFKYVLHDCILLT